MNVETLPGRDSSATLERLLKIGFGLGGLLSLAGGGWMLFAPVNWFEVFPGSIGDFGPQNAHFIRDLGGWYAAGGVLLLFALSNPIRFGGVALVVTLIAYFAHAAGHVADIVSGRVRAAHWIIDLPLVFAPVIIWFVLLWVWWAMQTERYPRSDEQL